MPFSKFVDYGARGRNDTLDETRRQVLRRDRDELVPAKFRGRSETVFNAATIHGAKAVGHGTNTIGSVQEGKLADFIVE